MRDYVELILDLRRHHCDAKEDDTQEVCEECAYDVIVADKSKFNGITDVCTCGLMHRAADAIEELLAFAKFVAREAIDTGDNDGVSAEILCRKLNKLGLIETDGEFWMLPTPPKGVE